MVRSPLASAGDRRVRLGIDRWVGKIPWRKARQPIPMFLSGESHGQRSLVGSELQRAPGHAEDMTEATEHRTAQHFEIPRHSYLLLVNSSKGILYKDTQGSGGDGRDPVLPN